MKIGDVNHPDVQKVQQVGNLLLGTLLTHQRDVPVNLAIVGCLDAAVRLVRLWHPEFSAEDAAREVARIAKEISDGADACAAPAQA